MLYGLEFGKRLSVSSFFHVDKQASDVISEFCPYQIDVILFVLGAYLDLGIRNLGTFYLSSQDSVKTKKNDLKIFSEPLCLLSPRLLATLTQRNWWDSILAYSLKMDNTR